MKAATVHALPSAASAPVVQHPRRGRFPKQVQTMWRARLAKSGQLRPIELRAQLALVEQELASNWAEFKAASEVEIKVSKVIDKCCERRKYLKQLKNDLEARLQNLGGVLGTSVQGVQP